MAGFRRLSCLNQFRPPDQSSSHLCQDPSLRHMVRGSKSPKGAIAEHEGCEEQHTIHPETLVLASSEI